MTEDRLLRNIRRRNPLASFWFEGGVKTYLKGNDRESEYCRKSSQLKQNPDAKIIKNHRVTEQGASIQCVACKCGKTHDMD